MGKRKKRLHGPKYAKKCASMRATYQRLRAEMAAAEADGVVTEQEAAKIKEIKDELVDTVVSTATEVVADVVTEIVDPPAPEVPEVVKEKKAKPAKAPKSSTKPAPKKAPKPASNKMPIKPRTQKKPKKSEAN